MVSSHHSPALCGLSLGSPGLWLAVATLTSGNLVLLGTWCQPHPSNRIGREAEPVLPSGVAVAVRLAQREGWTPTAPGSAFYLDHSAGFTPSN